MVGEYDEYELRGIFATRELADEFYEQVKKENRPIRLYRCALNQPLPECHWEESSVRQWNWGFHDCESVLMEEGTHNGKWMDRKTGKVMN